ncbi:MAG: M13 family metallopeptidase, partial [Gemmatimonadota bacterium]
DMDTTVRPGDNFYRFANGGWVAHTEIPADRSSYGSFNVADGRVQPRLKELVKDALASAAKAGSAQRQIADFYTAFLDQDAIDKRGLKPLQPALAEVAAIKTRTALARFIGASLGADVDVLNNGDLDTDHLFGLYLERDFAVPSQYAGVLMQGGLMLPDRSYYLDSTTAGVALLAKYREHISKMLILAGLADADRSAGMVVALETRIAAKQMDRTDTWEPKNGTHRWARTDFPRLAAGLDWPAFFAAAGMMGVDTLIAWQPNAIAGLSALAASEPLEAWRALFTYHAIERRAGVLPRPIEAEAFGFFGTTLGGVSVERPRADQAIGATSGALGFAVGRLYVERYFPASDKARAEKMVANIIAAFDRRIQAIDWMAPATKAEARRKLQTLRVSVGYPDVWPTYTDLRVERGDAYGNADRVEERAYRLARGRIGKPVDRAGWAMVPQQVNAVNLPPMNAMNFPAAILQPPFYDGTRPDVMNYGAIGAVIGHEISHSFDNLGSTFNADGKLQNWWTPEDLARFNTQAERLAAQFDSYHPFPDVAINGHLTLAEDLADLAGLSAAYDAYRASLGGAEAPTVDGWTGDQQFFLGFAAAWRSKIRDASLRARLRTDGHAPPMYRPLTVRNFDPWYAAFKVQPTDSLYLKPDMRVRIW